MNATTRVDMKLMPTGRRIVSFLPSATEMACALGLGDQLMAVTHECNYPPEIRDRWLSAMCYLWSA
jgi:ABC-type hemin transport system substrate-binding protein